MHARRMSLSKADSDDHHVVRIGPLSFQITKLHQIDDLVSYEIQVTGQDGRPLSTKTSAYYKTDPSDLPLGMLEDFTEMIEQPVTDLEAISNWLRADAYKEEIKLPKSVVDIVSKELQAKVKWALKHENEIKEALESL